MRRAISVQNKSTLGKENEIKRLSSFIEKVIVQGLPIRLAAPYCLCRGRRPQETQPTRTKRNEKKMDTQTDTTVTVVAPPVPTVTVKAEPETPKRPPGRPRAISDKALARARKLYEDGWSAEKISKQQWCNVTPSALYYHLRGDSPKSDTATEMRPRGRKGLDHDQLSFLVGQYQDGKTLGQIREMPEMKRKRGGKVVLWAMATLSSALKEAGITPRRGRPANPVVEESAESAEVEVAAE